MNCAGFFKIDWGSTCHCFVWLQQT